MTSSFAVLRLWFAFMISFLLSCALFTASFISSWISLAFEVVCFTISTEFSTFLPTLRAVVESSADIEDFH